LPLFRGLRALKIGEADRTDFVPLDVNGFKDTLEEFRSRSLVPSDLKTLSLNCNLIKYLDINGNFLGHIYILSDFLSFRHIVEMDLSRVSFIAEHLLLLILNCLSGLAILRLDSGETTDRSEFIRTLGCNLFSVNRNFPLIERFRNLTSLTLSNLLRMSLSELTKLKNLEKLTFINSRFSRIEGLLPKIGKRLKCLNLINVAGTDIRSIGRHCRILECLHFCFPYNQLLVLPIPGISYGPSPMLGNITTLKLHLDSLEVVERVLGYACNVKKLVMAFIFNDEDFLRSLFERTLLKSLEELHWGNIGVVQISDDVATVNRFYPDGRVHVRHRRV
jgi:hypothetical protein